MNINALRQAQDIAAAIKALKKTRNEHEEYLKPIETRTRQLLIDPMLEALGWDIRNPAQVHLEYKGSSGKPDYALVSRGNVVALIEAKKLEIPLARIKVEQVIKYARDRALTSLKYVVWTNGDHWQIWSIEEDREESFQLSNTQEYECALKAMQLLRSALEVQGQSSDPPPPRPTPKPAQVQDTYPSPPSPTSKPAQAQLPIDPSDAGIREPLWEMATSVPDSRQEVVDPSNNDGWIPLTSLKIEQKQKTPSRIRFPDSDEQNLKSGADMLVSVVEYLLETGNISAEDCPVPKRNSPSLYLLHTKPLHPDGKAFANTKKIRQLHLNTKTNPQDAWKNSCWLLERFGVNPSTVLVSTNRS